MKKQALTLLALLSLLLAAGSAFAQSETVRANIPFNFVVSRQALPAGEYVISSIGRSNDALLIRSADNKESTMVLANRASAGKPSDKTKLTFRCYGDRYFLSQIWVEGNDTGRQLPKSKHEAEVAMDYTPHDVNVLASLR